ncbi:MAG: ABC transporter ATP-binding protein [candidate division WOR-3 bacterium]
MLKVVNLFVYYGDALALEDVSLEVKENTLVALFGSNGAGKSTLLKTISGIIKPKKGNIYFFGEDLIGKRPEEVAQLGIAHIPEGKRLFGDLTVVENLQLGAFVKRARVCQSESIHTMFELFPPLKIKANTKARNLSGGEQQMLAIARGLMSRPKLVMIDEASQGLSPLVVNQLFEVILKFKRKNLTILLVEQNVRMALMISDYGYILSSGKIVAQGHRDVFMGSIDFRKAYLGDIVD